MADDFEYISHARLEYRKGYRHAYLGEVPEPVDMDRPTQHHGTPLKLLRCELVAVGYRQARLHLAGPHRRLSGGFHLARNPAAGRGGPTLSAVGGDRLKPYWHRTVGGSPRVCIPVTSGLWPELDFGRKQAE
jgi:hypothetical protein